MPPFGLARLGLAALRGRERDQDQIDVVAGKAREGGEGDGGGKEARPAHYASGGGVVLVEKSAPLPLLLLLPASQRWLGAISIDRMCRRRRHWE